MKNRTIRQSFLGEESDEKIGNTVIGIVGASGGGSHAVMQLRHIGFRHFRIFDPQTLEDSNLNRVITATPADLGKAKTIIAKSRILEFDPEADVRDFQGYWQDNPDLLRECDFVIGCVDGFQQRHELEEFCRRNLIPLIDIGMDVHPCSPPSISGQVILSMPGEQCMWCMGFLTQEILSLEASKYGAAGSNPQVIWPNGVLASLAVGVAVEITTGWTRRKGPVYLTYDGNRGTVSQHHCLRLSISCHHYPLSAAGDLRIDSIT